MSVGKRWRLLPHFLLRRAGFPFGVLETLAAPRSARAARRVADARTVAQTQRALLLGTLFPAEVRRAAGAADRVALRSLSRWRKQVGRKLAAAQPPVAGALAGGWSAGLVHAHDAWSAARREEASASAELTQVLGEESLAARVTLRAFFASPLAREALWLLSPDLLETMESALDRPATAESSAADRALERRLYAYAQRLASKNETTSFFGPLAYGQVEPTLPGGQAFSFGPETAAGVTHREAFLAFWASSALGKAASSQASLRRALPLRRVPVCSVAADAASASGFTARGPDGKPVPLEPAAAKLFSLVDGSRTVRELAEQVGELPEVVERQTGVLERLGLVRRLIEPRSTTSYPLADVLSQLPQGPEGDRWRTVGAELQDRLLRFATAALPRRRTLMKEAEALFVEATGVPARRAAGQTYADRTILYEDCLGDLLPLRMAQAEATRLEDALTPVLRLGAAYGGLRHAGLAVLAREVLGGMPGGRASFLAFSEALDARIAGGALDSHDAPARALLASLRALVKERAGAEGRVARLTAADLEALAPEAGQGRFASPDVMLALRADGGPPRFVIGEVHPYVFAWGSQGHFAPDPEPFFQAFRQDLSPWGGAGELAMVLRKRRHKGLVSHRFPGTFIEVTGRSVEDPARRVAISDLVVIDEAGEGTRAGRVRLLGPGGPLTLYTGEDDHPHLRAFAPPQVQVPPVRLEGGHTPRIEVGDCILQRERWEIAEGALEHVAFASGPEALAVEIARMRSALGLPRHLFCWSPTETKPLCLDLEIPLAQGHLQRLLSLGRLTLSEMLPGPGELWLGRAGGAHTSELRLAMVREQ